MSATAYNGDSRELEWEEVEQRLGEDLELVQQLDDVRYEDGVRYKHSDQAMVDKIRKNNAKQAAERSYREQQYATEIIDSIDNSQMDSESAEKLEQLERTVLSSMENVKETRKNLDEHGESFEGGQAKYDGENSTGPGTIIVQVEGNEHHIAQHSGTRISEDIWDEEVPETAGDIDAQKLYEVMEGLDGAMVLGRTGFLPHTYKIPDEEINDQDIPDNFPEHAGTKHLAALQAVHADIKNYYGEDVDVSVTVLSETDGYIRYFDSDGVMVEFEYDGDSRSRVDPEDFRQNGSIAEEKEMNEILENSG